MRKVILFILIPYFLISPNNKVNAQSASETFSSAAAATVAVLITYSILNAQQKKAYTLACEELAAEYVLSQDDRPKDFEIYLLNDVKTSQDILAFAYNPVDSAEILYKESSVLLWHISDGWVNEYGVDFSKVEIRELTKSEWIIEFGAFMSSISPMDKISRLVTAYKLVRTKSRLSDDELAQCVPIENDLYQPSGTIYLHTLDHSNGGLVRDDKIYIPFYLRDEYYSYTYRTVYENEEHTIINNNNEMGYYMEDLGLTFFDWSTIKRVNIHFFSRAN